MINIGIGSVHHDKRSVCVEGEIERGKERVYSSITIQT